MGKSRLPLTAVLTAGVVGAGLFAGAPLLGDAPPPQILPASTLAFAPLASLETRYFMVIPGGSRPLG